jgi:hypothetical protein
MIVYGGSSYVSKQSCSIFSSVWWWHNDALIFGHLGAFISTTASFSGCVVAFIVFCDEVEGWGLH